MTTRVPPLLLSLSVAVAAGVAAQDDGLGEYAIYAEDAPRPERVEPVATELPLAIEPGCRVALVGNTLFDRARHFGVFETLLQQRYGAQGIVVRNLAWSADTVDLRPRPFNFADTEQHLAHERAQVVLAAYGFNESFAGPEGLDGFRAALSHHVDELRRSAFDPGSAPRVVLVSPIANENVAGVAAADRNNANLRAYSDAMASVAEELGVGFVDVFTPTLAALADPETDLTINGIHLSADGYRVFAEALFRGLFGEAPPEVDEEVRLAVVDKSRQYFRRFRPLNTYYYTGKRRGPYGYLDFLPAMRAFDRMVANREERIARLVRGEPVPDAVDDSNLPPIPESQKSRGANRWMTSRDEWKSFEIDPRFEVTLFAGEEHFPDVAAPVQMRWDARGRLWVACSTTYPHVYPGGEPADKLVILEDEDGDGVADTSRVFADDLHIPLSFEFGDGGVYVSEMPDLTFLADTDGDDRADVRRRVLTGFGTEDSHHSLHDFTWTPDGDLIFRESVFHHSQVETPYGPVRQRNSGWFRFRPREHRLDSFGTYSSTNPWGVTFDDWGQHVASHPIFASAFHAKDPPYPEQHIHPKTYGLQAYSGVAGQEFVDFATFPPDMQGLMIKARYKPTNRIEILEWEETEFGYEERYTGDLIFSRNLSFIPVDVRFGPRGALYVCDWYNPIKGHAQYSLRDERRDRASGRIWRILPVGAETQEPPRFHDATVEELVELLGRREYRYRYWAKRELRERDAASVVAALDGWVAALDPADPRYRHHQLEASWAYRWVDAANLPLLRELLGCEEHRARAAAVRQLRDLHPEFDDADAMLRAAANDPEALVRLETATAASWIGTEGALAALLDTLQHPHGGHLSYAIVTAFDSAPMRALWEARPELGVPDRIAHLRVGDRSAPVEPPATEEELAFDAQPNLERVVIDCVPDRMKFSVERVTLTVGQPVKLVLRNEDSSDHNLVIVEPGAVEEVGVAANEMARDATNATSDFVPAEKRHLILAATPMIGPNRGARIAVLRFHAPEEPGIYPYVCTFPGHWIMMTGELVVVREPADIETLLAARPEPAFVRNWTVDELAADVADLGERSLTRGMKAFMTADCHRCHAVGDRGSPIGPDLTDVAERFTGVELLRQILEPSAEINPDFRPVELLLADERFVVGVVREEDEETLRLAPNLLAPDDLIEVAKADVVERREATLSAMPSGTASTLTKEELLDLLAFLEAGGLGLPEHGDH